MTVTFAMLGTLLRVNPGVRARLFDGYIGEPYPCRLTAGGPAVIGRDNEGAGFLVARPAHDNEALVCAAAVVEDHLLHSVIWADEQVPRIARRIATR